MPTAGVADRVVSGSLCTGVFKGAVLDSPYREWEPWFFVRLLKLEYLCLEFQGLLLLYTLPPLNFLQFCFA